MKNRIIGDIHGKAYEYRLITETAENSIQVGDFGIGFHGDYWHESINDYHRDTNRRFIRGNHDDPSMCKKMVGYIPDGQVESHGDNTAMFIGGAWSIDKEWRVEDLDWWADEELSVEEWYRLIEVYSIVKPDIMVTHDAPSYATKPMFIDSGKTFSKKFYPNRTVQGMDALFEIHKPKFWFFGHWHYTAQLEVADTHFHCLGVNDFVDFDMHKGEYIDNK